MFLDELFAITAELVDIHVQIFDKPKYKGCNELVQQDTHTHYTT